MYLSDFRALALYSVTYPWFNSEEIVDVLKQPKSHVL